MGRSVDSLKAGEARWTTRALYLWEPLHRCGVRLDSICRATRHGRTGRNANTRPSSLGWGLPVVAPESGSSDRCGEASVGREYRSGGSAFELRALLRQMTLRPSDGCERLELPDGCGHTRFWRYAASRGGPAQI